MNFISVQKHCSVFLMYAKKRVSTIDMGFDQQRVDNRNLAFCRPYFLKTKQKPVKTNTEQCFSTEMKFTCHNLAIFEQVKK